MDHPHYPYSSLPSRAPIVWPGAAPIAAFVVLYLEHWELAPPGDARRDPRFVGEFGSYTPDYRSWTQREYGNRIGIFRVLEVLDEAGIVPAVAVNTMALERYPRLVDLLLRRGCEILAHGTSATRMLHGQLPIDEERALLAGAREAIAARCGRAPAGWVGQDFGESARTPRLLAEAGFEYLHDWPNDDLPYRLRTDPPIVSLPNCAEWDDVQAQWLRRVPVTRYPAMIQAGFARLRDEALHGGGRVFSVGVHPWLSGMASRIRYLREALLAIRGAGTGIDTTWWTQPGDIVRHFVQHLDRLPPSASPPAAPFRIPS